MTASSISQPHDALVHDYRTAPQAANAVLSGGPCAENTKKNTKKTRKNNLARGALEHDAVPVRKVDGEVLNLVRSEERLCGPAADHPADLVASKPSKSYQARLKLG